MDLHDIGVSVEEELSCSEAYAETVVLVSGIERIQTPVRDFCEDLWLTLGQPFWQMAKAVVFMIVWFLTWVAAVAAVQMLGGTVTDRSALCLAALCLIVCWFNAADNVRLTKRVGQLLLLICALLTAGGVLVLCVGVQISWPQR
jgi:hypothetical protein